MFNYQFSEMGKHTTLIAILALYFLLHHCFALPNVAQTDAISPGPEAVQEWFETELPHAKEKLTRLHFYHHVRLTGKSPTGVKLPSFNSSIKFPHGFGRIIVMDDVLAVGPKLNSRIVGRVRGFYGSVSLEELGVLMAYNFVFTSGNYNGSALSVVGYNPFFHKVREMPVVGGTGVFRLARGVAVTRTVWFDTVRGNAVVEYNVMVLHY